MDTFDMLSPRYDEPQRYEDVAGALAASGMTGVQRTARYGLCLEARRVEAGRIKAVGAVA
jgi:hypothetical protein